MLSSPGCPHHPPLGPRGWSSAGRDSMLSVVDGSHKCQRLWAARTRRKHAGQPQRARAYVIWSCFIGAMVPGVRVHGNTVLDTEVNIDEQFRCVPVPSKLGVPIVYKKMPGTGGDDSHIRSNVIVRFMADVDDGFAPPEWQYGGRMGPAPPVVLARRDNVPFSKHDWDALDEYMEEWITACGEAEENRLEVSERYLTPEAFQTWIRGQRDAHPAAFLSLHFPVGSIVLAEGLSSADLNGKEGEVVRYSRDRVGVSFPERAVTALKPDRLKVVREAPRPMEPPPKKQDVGAKLTRQRELEQQEAMQISKRFVECMHQDTFPEMDDLHLFGVGCQYHSRATEVLAVWQGATKHLDLTEEMLAEALQQGTMKELLEKTCERLAETRTPNASYAKSLMQNNYAAVEWDTL